MKVASFNNSNKHSDGKKTPLSYNSNGKYIHFMVFYKIKLNFLNMDFNSREIMSLEMICGRHLQGCKKRDDYSKKAKNTNLG